MSKYSSQHKYHKTHPYLQYEGDQQHLHGYHNGSAIIIPHLLIVDLLHIADMDESYGTYVDDEYFDNHEYDDTDDDTDDDNDHKKDSYTAAGAAPTQTRPGQARPQKYFMFDLFWHEWASDRRYEALDSTIMKDFSSSIDLAGSRA